jgi:spermidine synthase
MPAIEGQTAMGRRARKAAATSAPTPPAVDRRAAGTLRRALPATLLFASGLASLVYQALWIKQLALIVGVDVYAVTIGISAFFAGLALGGWWLGRQADRVQRPMLLYAALELAVALAAVGATMALAGSAPLFVALERSTGWAAWLLPFALVGLPAIPMGATLPAMVVAARALGGERDAPVARAGGALYAANTLGAMGGVLLATFALIPALGVQGAALAAATLNVLLALAALCAGIDVRRSPVEPAPSRPTDASRSGDGQRLAVALYAAAGGVALGYEVVWTQVVVQFASTRSFAFAIVLATYLAGLMLGSAVYARFAERVRDPWGAFAVLVAAAGLLALLQVSALGTWLPALQARLEDALLAATGTQLAAMCGRFALAAACIVLGPTLLLGAAFPAALRLAARSDRAGRDVGAILALNTAGGIAGTFLAGFVMIPWLGLVHALGALALLASAIGFLAVWRGAPRAALSAWPRAVLGGIAIAATGTALLAPSDLLARLLAATRGGTLVAYDESPGGTVAVLAQGSSDNRFRRLYIQGVSNSGDSAASLRYMRLQALLPLVVHAGEPRSALVIALGTGITAGALTQYPGLDRRVAVELLPAVLRAAPRFEGNYGVASDARMDIRLRDGRHELLRDAARYDLITLEPPPPSAAGVANLYSRDFYRLASERLEPGGVFAQWLPIATQNDEDTRSLVRSFLDVFPHASLWTTELHEMLLVGSMVPMPLDAARIEAHFAQAPVAAALTEVGISSPAALLSTWVTGTEGLKRYAAGAPPVTDDRPLIEYAAWVRPGEFSRVLPELLALRTEVPVQGASPALLASIAREREALLAFYDAGLAAYDRDEARWRAAMDRMAREADENAYYRRMLNR